MNSDMGTVPDPKKIQLLNGQSSIIHCFCMSVTCNDILDVYTLPTCNSPESCCGEKCAQFYGILAMTSD